MDDTRARVKECFELVFPDLPEGEIANATQDNVAAWDSVAAITLLNVLEEQFEIEMDLDEVADLDSFEKVCAYMEQRREAA
jgi:acyl carrier protein